MQSQNLLAAVADALVPGVTVEDDGALRAEPAPFARLVEERRPGTQFAVWSRADREALVGELLADRTTPLGSLMERVLLVTARTFYGDPASWPELGYRPMQPGTSWPPTPGVAPVPISVEEVGDSYDVVVVGAGAGGGVASCVLAEAGHRILLVERGEALTLADLPRDHLRNARAYTGLKRQVDPPTAGNPRFHGEDLVLPDNFLWHNSPQVSEVAERRTTPGRQLPHGPRSQHFGHGLMGSGLGT